MSHLSTLQKCDSDYQLINDKEFKKIETGYLKYQIGGEDVSRSDIKEKMNENKEFDDHIITYFYILIFRNQGEKKSLNHAISFLITDDDRFIEINHYSRGENPIVILEKTIKVDGIEVEAVDPILINNKKVDYSKNTYQYGETQWNGGIIYKGIPEQQVSLRDVYKRVVIHTADFDIGRGLIEGKYFFSKKRSHTTSFPGSCTGITETIFHMLSPVIYENDYMSDLYSYDKHIDYQNMFYNSDRPIRRKSTKKKSRPTKKKSRPTKKKSSRFSFTRVTSRRRKSAKKTSRRRKSTKVTSRRRKSAKKTSRRRKSAKKTSRRRKSTKKTSRRRKSIN